MFIINDFQLPSFSGFYESIWVDDERFFYDCKERGIEKVNGWEIDWSAYKNDVGREYAHRYEVFIRQYMHLSGFNIIFNEIVSPREYNFFTDRIFCTLEIENLSEFLGDLVVLAFACKDELEKMIRDNHTSCSGFISLMSNKLDEWLSLYLNPSALKDEDNAIYLSYFIYYLLILYGDFNYEYTIDDYIYEIVSGNGIYLGDYYRPVSDEAKAELKAIELKEEQEAWDRENQLKIPFPDEN